MCVCVCVCIVCVSLAVTTLTSVVQAYGTNGIGTIHLRFFYSWILLKPFCSILVALMLKLW